MLFKYMYFFISIIYTFIISLLLETTSEFYFLAGIILIFVIVYFSWNVGLKELPESFKDSIEYSSFGSIFAIFLVIIIPFVSLPGKCLDAEINDRGIATSCLEYNSDYKESDFRTNMIILGIYSLISLFFYKKYYSKIKN